MVQHEKLQSGTVHLQIRSALVKFAVGLKFEQILYRIHNQFKEDVHFEIGEDAGLAKGLKKRKESLSICRHVVHIYVYQIDTEDIIFIFLWPHRSRNHLLIAKGKLVLP